MYSDAQNDPIFEDLSGMALFDALRNNYKPSFVLPYNDARDVLFGTIDKVNDSLECIYSGYKVYMTPGVDPTTAACGGDGCPGINTEHTYPQSLWNGGNSPKSDMHHLFPTKAAVNNARSSKPFADIQDNFTDKWYYKSQELTSVPTSNIDLYAESVSSYFEPRESSKGNIARAMFYFYTMYRNEADAVDNDFFNEQVNTLCEWHNQDPASYDEALRTWKIAEYQDWKPNPFVLDCTLASRIYCNDVLGWYCNIITANEDLDIGNSFTISPNPAQDRLDISWDGDLVTDNKVEVILYDMAGKELKREEVYNGMHLEINTLPRGMIMAKLQYGRQICTKKFVKM